MSDPCPRARALEPIPVEAQGQQMIVLRDPQGFSEDVVISPAAYFFLAHCDGQHALSDIKLAFVRQFQQILADQDAQRILDELDRHYLLENERSQRHCEQVIEAYGRDTVRRAAHAGAAYPDDAEALRAQLDTYYTAPEGPGAAPATIESNERRLPGLIAPHISVSQGGACFAWAYKRICESPPADTYVILGTGHAEIPGCFAATRKTFESPLGSTAVDVDFLDRLEKSAGIDLCKAEIFHRKEHVIEFQLIFLQHALGERSDFRIVPILCSFQPQTLADGTADPVKAAIVEQVANALRKTIEESPQNVCLIASADLAHMGYRYGEPVALGQGDLDRIETEDRETLRVVCSGDARGFLDNLASDGNRRNVCGFPCIYTMLRARDFADGELLRYGQSAMDEHNSTVSYASVAFDDPASHGANTSAKEGSLP